MYTVLKLRRSGEEVVAEVKLDEVAEAIEGVVRQLHHATPGEVDALKVHETDAVEFAAREALEDVSGEVEDLGGRRQGVRDGREASPSALHGLLSATPLAAAYGWAAPGRVATAHQHCDNEGQWEPALHLGSSIALSSTSRGLRTARQLSPSQLPGGQSSDAAVR